ncbi:UNVERIFIED_CONTAM: hypothetical protein FKN15_057704 [Acipenser sinensis]
MAVYYCGALKDSRVLFGNGTALLLKGIESRGRIIQPRISESVQSYYCAEVKCGEDITGNGAKKDGKAGDESLLTPPVIVLAVTNIVLLISMTVLVCLRIKEGKCKSFSGFESRGSYQNQPPNISESVQTNCCAVATCGEDIIGNGTKEAKTGIESRGRIIQPPISESVQSYYCAVVTCGEISNGNGTKEDSTGNVAAQAAQTNADSTNDQNQQMLDYAALDFDQRRNKPGKKKRAMNKESVYAEVRVQQRE